MVIINGTDPVLVQYLVQRLAERGHALAQVAPDAHLFSEATQRRATMLVSVDGDASDDEQLDDLMAAASSPAAPMVVYVSPRLADDEGLGRLRKSGAPYVVLHIGHMPSWALSQSAEGVVVAVGTQLPVPAQGITTGPMLVEALERVFTEDVAVGSSILVTHLDASNAWEKALESVGAKPRPASALRQRFARWRGRPCLFADGDDVTLHNSPSTAPDGGEDRHSTPTQEGVTRGRYHTAA